MKTNRLKNYLKLGILLFGISISVIACQQDDTITKEEHSASAEAPTITTFSFEEADETFNRLKEELKIEKFLKPKQSSNLYSRTTQDTLGLTIATDIIKEVTLGDYTSYTMEIIHEADSTVFYNLTIEYKNGESGIFITKYTPTEYWLNNKDEAYQGDITSMRIQDPNTLQGSSVLEDIGDEGSGGTLDGDNSNPDLGVGTGGVGGNYTPQGSPYYPTDCSGIVIVTMEEVPYQCACGDWPWDVCQGCPPEYGSPQYPGYNYIPYYYCQDYGYGDNTSGSTDGTIDGGPQNPDEPIEDTSIAATIKPDECTERITGDLNGDCTLDAYETCLLNGNSQEVCECVRDGGSLVDCQEDIKCERLKRLVQNDSIGSNILPIVNQLRTKLGVNENEWSISYENKWVDGTRKNVPDENGIQEGISRTRSIFSYGTTWVGQIHTHPENTYPIFSWLDLRALMLIDMDSHEDFNDEVFLMVVAPNNITYALKVDNIQTLTSQIEGDIQNARGNNIDKKKNNLMNKMKKKYDKSNNFEKTFLNLFGNYGISLYKATDENLSSWNKLELDENDSEILNEIPCN